MIASGSRDDRVTATEAVLPHDMRCDVRVAGLGEIAVRCAADEPSITRRLEPPLRLTIRDDGGRWLLLLMVALPPSPAIPAVPTPIAVELLLLRATAIIATRFAVIAMVAIGAIMFRGLIAIALRIGLNPIDLKLATAAFVLATLALPNLKWGKRRGGAAR